MKHFRVSTKSGQTVFTYTGGIPGLMELRGTLFVDNDGAKKAGINTITVSPAYRGKGIGRQVIKDVEQSLKTRGVRVVMLNSYHDSVPFWKKLGYKGRTARSGLTHLEKRL